MGNLYADILFLVKAYLDPDGFAPREVNQAEERVLASPYFPGFGGLTITDGEGVTWFVEFVEDGESIGPACEPFEVKHIRR